MNKYQVVVNYKRDAQIIEEVMNITASSKYDAKVEAKKRLNRKGIYGSFTYDIYVGDNTINDSELEF
jgi:hypothetical protein